MLTTLPLDEARAWLRLTLEPELTAAQARKLLAAIGLPQEIYASSTTSLARFLPQQTAAQLSRAPSGEVETAIEETLKWLDQPGHAMLTLADELYPPALLDIHDPPLLLYANGDLSLLSRPAISIVGARNATPGGIDNAIAFARHLASQGWCVVSGLAAGIDAAAHRGALSANPSGGSTIAVMATGLDIVYPASNLELARRIASEGLLISEAPLGTPSKSFLFPRRNRIVAGLGQGVLVVEATRKSGSLITARLASEMGREVFAIPGSIHSPQSRGCHALIRQGAKLVESGQDITDELGHLQQRRAQAAHENPGPQREKPLNARQTAVTPTAPGKQAVDTRTEDGCTDVTADGSQSLPLPGLGKTPGDAPPPSPPNEVEAGLLEAMAFDPVDIDILHRRTGLDIAQINSALLELELSDTVVRLPDGRVQRRKA